VLAATLRAAMAMRTLVEALLTGAMLLLWFSATSAAYEATPPSRAAAASAPASGRAASANPARPAGTPGRSVAPVRASRGETATLCACVHPRAASGGSSLA